MSKKVVILGGGVAGMSAAHELIERGFSVEVYEKKEVYSGGKARSVNVPGSNTQHPDEYLPGEHGFRFFPGFYRHVTDTMKRIPFTAKDGTANKYGVYDNLVEVDRVEIARYGRKPIQTVVNFPKSKADLEAMIGSMHAGTGLTEAEKDLFVHKVWQLMTSCYDRRVNDYERLGWWQFMDADQQSDNYQSLLVEGLTRTLVAANAKFASTKTGGDIFLQLIFNICNPFKHTDRVLNGPTNDAWLNPWLKYLTDSGVKYNFDCSVQRLDFKNGQIAGAYISKGGSDKLELVTGDYYILATPVEVAAPLITKEMLAYDTTLQGVETLAKSVAWMNGMQFYLNQDVEIVHGHCIYADSQWAVTSISQIQFWKDYDLSNKYNGKVKGILSVDISNWYEKGLNGKMAHECTPLELKEEIWAQIKKSVNVDGQEVLTDDMIVTWFLDTDIQEEAVGTDEDSEPLLVNTINSWGLRPESYSRIKNLFFASDYVRTYTDLATMEGANEAARRAVNNILDASGSNAEPCKVWNLHEPIELEPFRHHDQKRYDAGLSYRFHEGVLMKEAIWIIKLIKKIIDFFKGSKS
ncbi:MAG: FAD-dependent oxidoreductase [Chitinophagaceae bacterium]|nr:FAD-dependent oxidoreductase [Chitinophagaceae bacterium]